MKTSTKHATNTPRRSFGATVRDELRERRQARCEDRALSRELASYTTRSEVDDLLAAVDRQASPEADRIREILNRNVLADSSHPLVS